MASSLKAGARPCRKIWFLYFIFFSIWICSYVSVCICLFVFVLYLRSIFSAQQMIKLERWRRCACPPDYLYGKSFFRSSARASTKVFIPASSKRWLGWVSWSGRLWWSVMDCDGHIKRKNRSQTFLFSVSCSLSPHSPQIKLRDYILKKRDMQLGVNTSNMLYFQTIWSGRQPRYIFHLDFFGEQGILNCADSAF